MTHIRLHLLLWNLFVFDVLAAPQTFWAAHILNARFTGPANKDLANLECDVGFVAGFCFGEQKTYSDFNSEMHVIGTVFEWNQVTVDQWHTGAGSYLSCCPPGSKGNSASYYRCNTWTTENHDNCHTLVCLGMMAKSKQWEHKFLPDPNLSAGNSSGCIVFLQRVKAPPGHKE